MSHINSDGNFNNPSNKLDTTKEYLDGNINEYNNGFWFSLHNKFNYVLNDIQELNNRLNKKNYRIW